MKRIVYFVSIVYLFVNMPIVKAQQNIRIKVVDNTDEQPISYAVVYPCIHDKSKFLLANEVGECFLSESSVCDTFMIASLGYYSFVLAKNKLLSDNTITLKQNPFIINEVVVNSPTKDIQVIGNVGKKSRYHHSLGYETKLLRIIENEDERNGLLTKIEILINNPLGEETIPVRIRVFEYAKDSIIGRDLLQGEVLMANISKGKKWLVVNVTDYAIELPPLGVLVGVELLGKDSYPEKKVNSTFRNRDGTTINKKTILLPSIICSKLVGENNSFFSNNSILFDNNSKKTCLLPIDNLDLLIRIKVNLR